MHTLHTLSTRIMMVFLATMTLRVALTSVAPVLEQMMHDMQINRSLASLIFTIPVICMGIFAVSAPRLSLRFGLERVIGIALLLSACATILRSFFPSIIWITLQSFFIGIGIAIAGPLLSAYVKKYCLKRTNFSMSMYSFGIAVSGFLGSLLTLPLMNLFNLSWQTGLSFWGIFIGIIATFWLYFHRHSTIKVETMSRSIELPWRNGRAWILTFGFALQSGNFYAVLAWFPGFMIEQGLTRYDANSWLNIIFLTAPIGTFSFPILSQYIGRRQTLILASLGSLSALLLIALTGTHWLMPATILAGITIGGGLFSLIMLQPLYEGDTPAQVANLTAMMLAIGYLISAITPSVLGVIRDLYGSYQPVFMVLCLNTVVMIGLFCGFKNTRVHQS